MAANQRSLALTDAYRRKLLALGDRVEAQARQAWPRIEDLDATDWPERTATALASTQTQAVRLTGGYLVAYIHSEGGRGTVPAIDSRKYAGVARDGRPLAEALQSPIIGVLGALKQGETANKALQLGLVRALRTVKFEAVQAGRDALTDAIEADERVDGFERSVAGTCAACMALSGTPNAEVHPGCECVPQPTVVGAVDRFPLPSGGALFSALSKPEQESAIGPEAAQLVRDGNADLKDFVAHSPLETDQPSFVTQRPVEEVATA